MIKKLTKRLGRSSVLALIALAAIVTTGTGCDDILGPAFAGFPFHSAASGTPAPEPAGPKETVTWTDGYEVIIWETSYE